MTMVSAVAVSHGADSHLDQLSNPNLLRRMIDPENEDEFVDQ
jgi:hypothetical protein